MALFAMKYYELTVALSCRSSDLEAGNVVILTSEPAFFSLLMNNAICIRNILGILE